MQPQTKACLVRWCPPNRLHLLQAAKLQTMNTAPHQLCYVAICDFKLGQCDCNLLVKVINAMTRASFLK